MDSFTYSDDNFDEAEILSSIEAEKASATVKNFADLLAAIDSWADLTLDRRYFLANAVRHCLAIISRNQQAEHLPPATFACDIAWLNGVLFRQPARAHGLGKRVMGNYVCGLRQALRRAGILNDGGKAHPPAEGPWAALLAALNCTYAVGGLAFFAEWCAARTILPDAVDSNTLADFEHHLATQRLLANPRHKTGNLAKSWRRLVKSGVVKPGVAVIAPNRREGYTLSLDAFSAAFQAELAQFAKILTHTHRRGPYRGDGPPKPQAPSTVKTRLFSLRQAASALVHEGWDPATISLAVLVTPETFDRILTHFWERAIALKVARGEVVAGEDTPEDGVTTQTNAIARALIMAAQYVVKPLATDLAEIRALAKSYTPDMQSEISPKMRTLLNKLSHPATRVRLLHLPSTLMLKAEALLTKAENAGEPPPLEAARLAMTAVAIKIELMLPLRIGNLAHLRLDTQLQRFSPRDRLFSKLCIPAAEVKNNLTIDWPIDPGTGAFIEHYLQSFRPLLNPGDSPWLFPSNYGGQQDARSVDALRKGITEAVAEHVGVTMHVHAFRGLAAMLLLEDAPGGLEDLRLLLGHKTYNTAQRYYTYIKPEAAAQRFAGIMERARKGLSPTGGAKQRPDPRQWASPTHRGTKR